MSRHLRRILIGSISLCCTVAAAQSFNAQINRGVGDLTRAYRTGGLKAAQDLSAECWRRLSRSPEDVEGAVRCSTYGFALSFIDNQASALKGEDAQISIIGANAQARAALAKAGVTMMQLPATLGGIRDEAAQALTRSKLQ